MATSIADLNRQVTVRHFISYKDDKGVPDRLLSSTNTRYASVQLISNLYVLQQIQVNFQEAYRFTFRDEHSLLIYPTDDILYNNRKHTINTVTKKG